MKTGTLLLAVALVTGLLAAEAVAVPATIGYWKFDEYNTTPGNHNSSSSDFQVIDSSGNHNQAHSYQGDGDGFNYGSSTDTPPRALFAGSNLASFQHPTAGPGNGGVLFHSVSDVPPGNGNDFNFAGRDFTLEGYFKTSDTTNRQDIIFNAQGEFSYLVNVNEGGAGVLRFAVGSAPYPQVNLGGGAGHNYANGDWHYFVARYDERGPGAADVLSLTTYDQTGAPLETGIATAPVGYDVRSTTRNLGLGSTIFANPFRGLLDEVRISRGLVEERWQLNRVGVTVDTFDNTHDYKASGVAGTAWHGLMHGGNATTVATTSSPTTAGDGNLTVAIPAAVNVGWDATHNNAPFLFKFVGGDTPFDAQMVIESTTDANYSVAGLMVRLPDPLSDGIPGVNNQEDFLTLTYDNFGTWHSMRRRSLDDGVQTDLRLTPDGIQHPYLRLTRVGDLFSLYTRPNDWDEWSLRDSLSRPDLAGRVQVGLWYGLFGGGAGTAEIENFILYTGVPEPGTLSLLGLGGLALWRRRRRPR